jgi:transposase-like protein
MKKKLLKVSTNVLLIAGFVMTCDDVFANGIENFWGIAKGRLAKLRGIRKEKFYLKETEWHFNHRQENIYKLLLSKLRKLPL